MQLQPGMGRDGTGRDEAQGLVEAVRVEAGWSMASNASRYSAGNGSSCRSRVAPNTSSAYIATMSGTSARVASRIVNCLPVEVMWTTVPHRPGLPLSGRGQRVALPAVSPDAGASRVEAVEVAREQRRAPDVVDLQQPGRPSLQTDGEAAVRWHAVAERL